LKVEMTKTKLTEDEKDILESVDAGEWKSADEDSKTDYKAIAKETLKKEKRINIRLSSRDLDLIQRKAAREGIPYQTLIGSILHKYANGYLKDVG